mgnify:CR=1 FL=1
MTDHIAIMKKSWNLTNKILRGEKTIESRWYKQQYPPWNKIKAGETIYFKDSGEPVTLKARVEKIVQFENLNENKVKKILENYGEEDGIEEQDITKFFNLFKDKKYCILIYLKDPKKIPPFNINKKGFGAMSAWLCINNVEEIKI